MIPILTHSPISFRCIPSAPRSAKASKDGAGASKPASESSSASDGKGASGESPAEGKRAPAPLTLEDYDPSKARYEKRDYLSLIFLSTPFSQHDNFLAHSYDPIADACWNRGEHVPYQALAATFDKIDTLSKRLEIVASLRNFFR